jgi:hypothetical protein
MRARPLVHAAAAAVALTALAGCQKPTPGVTVSSGATSSHIEATVFCRDGQSVQKQDCVQHLDRVAVVRVKSGERVGIDVDTSLAKHGWILFDTGANARSNIQDEHYFTYTPDFRQNPIVNLEVRSLDKVSESAQVTGVWKIQLVEQ